MFSLQRQIFNLILDLPDLLLSILKDEKLFQFGAHVALKLVTRRSGVNRTQRLLRARADGNVLRQIYPLDDAVAINVKFGWAGDVVPFWPGAAMQNVVTFYHRRVGIRQKREGVTEFPAVRGGDVDRVDADGCEMHASFLEISQPPLKTP